MKRLIALILTVLPLQVVQAADAELASAVAKGDYNGHLAASLDHFTAIPN